MISVVIRNKNEAKLLERTLKVLTKFYKNDIDEIILVDNNSTDKSVEIANQYNCKIVHIDKFTYGKAINLGIESAKNDIILLLSSHAIPIGNSFFKNSIQFITEKNDWAGIRFINSAKNFERALESNFEVKQPLDFGLMAACCLVSKQKIDVGACTDRSQFREVCLLVENSRGEEILKWCSLTSR